MRHCNIELLCLWLGQAGGLKVAITRFLGLAPSRQKKPKKLFEQTSQEIPAAARVWPPFGSSSLQSYFCVSIDNERKWFLSPIIFPQNHEKRLGGAEPLSQSEAEHPVWQHHHQPPPPTCQLLCTGILSATGTVLTTQLFPHTVDNSPFPHRDPFYRVFLQNQLLANSCLRIISKNPEHNKLRFWNFQVFFVFQCSVHMFNHIYGQSKSHRSTLPTLSF